jgi:hypothetical protein
MLTACDFDALKFKISGADANKPLTIETKPSHVKVRIFASQVIDDGAVDVRGYDQLELELAQPQGMTTSTYTDQVTGDGSKQISIAALDKG